MKSASEELLKSAAKEYLTALSPDKRNQFLVECTGETRRPARLVTQKQAAEILSVTTRSIQRYIREGELSVVRHGRICRIPEDQLFVSTSGGAAK